MTGFADKFIPNHPPGEAESESPEQTSQEIENEIKLPDSLDALDSVPLCQNSCHLKWEGEESPPRGALLAARDSPLENSIGGEKGLT